MTKAVFLFGPTASGKTTLSIELSQKINSEIISADSIQVYRFMDLGTAKPSQEQRKKIPHYLIDIVNPDQDWTVADFIDNAKKCIFDIKSREKIPLIVGGTGLYLNALINGYGFPIVNKDKNVRNKLSEFESAKLHEKLENIDPQSALKINKNDKKRLIRALEVYELTGKPISQLQRKAPHNKNNLKLFCINIEREILYERIDQRVDVMLSAGLVDEVKSLLEKYNENLNSMQALGYKEVISYLKNNISYGEMVELIKKRTRNFAKRQLSWFRGFQDVNWIEAENDLRCTGLKPYLEILSK